MVPVYSSFQRGAKAWVALYYQLLPQAWGARHFVPAILPRTLFAKSANKVRQPLGR